MVLWSSCVLSRPSDCPVCSAAIPATVFPSCLCGLTVLVSRKAFWLVMGSDGLHIQKKKSWVSGQVRAERVLAEAITIDGRKEWTCKFCSESNVWTRWRCRRCYHNILATLFGKYRQAVAAKSGEWSAGSSASSGEEERKARSLEAQMKSSEHELMLWKRRKEQKKGSGIFQRRRGFRRSMGRLYGSRG